MADQVAVALDNASLLTETQELLAATQRAYGEISRAEWVARLSTAFGMSYLADQTGVVKVDATDVTEWEEEARRAWEEGRMVRRESEEQQEGSLALPIQVRNETIGVLNVSRQTGYWTAGEITQLETLADQLGMALENARLLERTRQRAYWEQTLSSVTDAIRAEAEVEVILERSLEELGRVLHAERAFVQLSGDVAPVAQESGATREVEG